MTTGSIEMTCIVCGKSRASHLITCCDVTAFCIVTVHDLRGAYRDLACRKVVVRGSKHLYSKTKFERSFATEGWCRNSNQAYLITYIQNKLSRHDISECFRFLIALYSITLVMIILSLPHLPDKNKRTGSSEQMPSPLRLINTLRPAGFEAHDRRSGVSATISPSLEQVIYRTKGQLPWRGNDEV